MNRYARQTVLKEIGDDQKKLSQSSVAIIGLGALGANSSDLLARAGIDKLILIDRDYVELHNLQRQTLFAEEDVDRAKAIAAKDHLKKVNSEVKINAHAEDFNWKNAEELVKSVDIILDGTDNLETRFLINDLSVKREIPWIHGACIGVEGESFNVIPGGPCFRCLISQLPKSGSLETCETMGILNSVPMLIASRQVTEAIKILLNKDYSRQFFRVDLWRDKFELIDVKKNENCPTCGKGNFEFLNGKVGSQAIKLCGRNTFQVKLPSRPDEFEMLSKKLRSVGEVSFNEHVFHISINGKRLSLFKNGRVIINGVEDEDEAKSFCARYIS